MTIEDFVKGLSPEQNAALLAFRDQINAQQDAVHSALTASTAKDVSEAVAAKETAVKDKAYAVAELTALKAFSAELLDQARKIDHPEVQAIVTQADKPENERKLEALNAQIAELQKDAKTLTP